MALVVFSAQSTEDDAKATAHGLGQRSAGFVANTLGHPTDRAIGLAETNNGRSQAGILDVLGGRQPGQLVEYAVKVEGRQCCLAGEDRSFQRLGQVGADVVGNRVDPAALGELA